jgi:hypothetical protein
MTDVKEPLLLDFPGGCRPSSYLTRLPALPRHSRRSMDWGEENITVPSPFLALTGRELTTPSVTHPQVPCPCI